MFGVVNAQTRLVVLSPSSGSGVSVGSGISLVSSLSQPMTGASGGHGVSVQSGISIFARVHNFLSGVHTQPAPVPRHFSLAQNFPNPFNPSTSIGFTLQESGPTTLKVYDIVGREVATLVNEVLEAGVFHQKIFHASGFSSGVYFIRLQSGKNTLMKKMLLIK